MAVTAVIATYNTLTGVLPTGGTVGQVVTKLSATDYDANWQTPVSGITLPLGQHLTFAPDITYNIGAPGASRPNVVYAGSAVLGPGATLLTLGAASSGAYVAPSAGGNLMLASGGVASWQIDFTTKSLLAGTDNTYDIGASGANRPRTIYVGTSVITPKISVDTIALGQASSDVFLVRDAVGTLALRNGTAPQFLQVYNTYTDGSNYERMLIGTTGGGAPTISYQAAGTGSTVRLFRIQGTGGIAMAPAGTDTWFFGSGGSLAPAVDNAYDIGAPATRVRTVYANTISVTAGNMTAPQINADVFALGQSSPDIFLVRESFGVLAQRNGTNSQTFRWYGSYTDGSNYDRIGLWFSGTAALFLTEQAGTGVARELRLGTSGAQPVMFQTNNTIRWLVNSTGSLVAYVDNTVDIGQPTQARPRNIYMAGGIYQSYNPGAGIANDGTNYERFRIEWASNVLSLGIQNLGTGAARPMVIQTPASAIYIRPGGLANDWLFHPNGNFLADVDNTYDIGASATNRPRTIYVATSVVGPGAVPTGGTTGQVLQKNTATNYDYAWITPSGGGITLPLGQTLTFSPDNTYDIGASAASRPRTIYAGTSVVTPLLNTPLLAPTGNVIAQRNGTSAQVFHVYNTYTDPTNYERLVIYWTANQAVIRTEGTGTGVSRPLYLGALGASPVHLYTNGQIRWTVDPNGHFLAGSDDIWDIGAVAASRPRNVYTSRGFIGPGAVPTGGTTSQVLSKVDATDYNLAWITPSGGGLTLPLSQTLTFSPDNTYDIGAAATTRPRSIYVGTSLTLPVALPSLLFAGATTGIGTVNVATHIGVMVNGTSVFRFEGGAHRIGSAIGIGWSSAVDPNAAGDDVMLWRGGAGVLEQRNGTAAQTLNIYNTYTDVNNFERLYIQGGGATAFRLSTAVAGTGTGKNFRLGLDTSNSLILMTAGADRWLVDSTGMLIASADNTYDIGTTTSTGRIRNLYSAGAINAISFVAASTATLSGSGLTSAGNLTVGAGAVKQISFNIGGVTKWYVDATAGFLFAGNDNTLDIGAAAANRPRTIYAGTSFIGPGSVPTGGTANQVLQKNTATNYDVGWVTPSGGALSWPLLAPDGTTGAPSYSFTNNSGTGLTLGHPAGWLGLVGASTQTAVVGPGEMRFGANTVAGWSSNAVPILAALDVVLARDAANTLAQRNGVNPQTLRIYNTYTDASNYERLVLTTTTGGAASVLTQSLGTGVARPLVVGTGGSADLFFQTNATNRWRVDANGWLLATTDNLYDIGWSGGNFRPRNIYQSGGVFHSYNPSSGIANDTTNYERLEIGWGSNLVTIAGTKGGTGVARSMIIVSSNEIQLQAQAVAVWRVNSAGLWATTDNTVDIGASGANRPRTVYAGTSVVTPALDSAIHLSSGTNIVEQRNGTNPQTWRLYNTYIDASNYSSFEMAIGAGQIIMRNRSAGSGSAMPLIIDGGANTFFLTASAAVRLQIFGATRWGVETATVNGQQGHWVPGTDNAYDIGWSNQSVRDLYVAGTISKATGLARRNQLVNGGLEIWQRGAGPFTLHTLHGPDRWQLYLPAGTTSVSRDTANIEMGSGAGACAAVTIAAPFSPANGVYQLVTESALNHLAGLTVSLSVRIKCSQASSVRVGVQSNRAASLPTTWSSYHTGGGAWETLTTTLAIAAGTAGVTIWVLGAVAGTWYMDNAMLVVGPQANDFVPMHPADDLARCLRYYETFTNAMVAGVEQRRSPKPYIVTLPFRQIKPVTATATLVAAFANVNVTGNASVRRECGESYQNNVRLGVVSTAAGTFYSSPALTILEANP